MRIDYYKRLDKKLLDFCSVKLKNKRLDRMMPIITHSNDFGFIYITLIILSILMDYKTYLAAGIFASICLGLILGEGLLKHLIKRKRPICSVPCKLKAMRFQGIYSFPSGHTTSSFAAFGVMWFMHSQLWLIFLIFAILISFSRIYLQVHYPTDVFAGMLLGLICSKLAVFLANSTYMAIIISKGFNLLMPLNKI